MNERVLNHWIMVLLTIVILVVMTTPFAVGQDFKVKQMTTVPGKAEFVPGEIIVKFKPGVSERNIFNINRGHVTEVIYTSPFAGFKRLRIPPAKTIEEMVEIYSKNPNVEYAEPNSICYAFMVPDDPGYSLQWHLDNPEYGGIHMESAWDIGTGDSSVIVAVIDTGVAFEDYVELIPIGRSGKYKEITYQLAPDLASTNFVAGYDFVNNDDHPNDDDGHGTHVTGTIAQSTNNNLGVAGVAFNTSIMPVKVLDSNSSGTHADIANGIYFAADYGANIINMSLGGASGSITLENAVAYAYGKGVTIVCASGNDGSATTVSYPAAYDAYCIAVGATRYDEAVAYYSNGGPSLDLTAPGGDVTVDQNNDGYADGVLQQTFGDNPTDWDYWFYQGTSMASPHVAGVAALLIANGVTGPDNVRIALQATAEDHGSDGWDSEYGWGIVDAAAALGVITLSIADAAAMGLMNRFCYTFEDNQYRPIDPYELTDILPWSGFWVVVKDSLDLLIPENPSPPDYDSEMTLIDLEKGRFYLISSPLDPSSNRDINVNFGDDLGTGLYEQKWRVSKWDYDTEKYENYTGLGSLAELLPGRGFFIQHIYDEPTDIDISGNPAEPPGDYYELKLPSNGDPFTYHMAGNPYWYPIQWKDCKVRVPMTGGLPLAKPTVLAQEDIESWHLGFKLESFDGKSRDTYNRAGVIMTPGVDPKQLCALDLTPPGNYVRLALKDPFDEAREPLTYDYRPSGLYEYSWEVELTTTYDKIDVKFTLDNFEFVPDDFSIILKDTESGDVLTISDDISFDLELTSGSTKTYVLTATSMLNAETIVEEEEDQKPVSFGITGIRPNPFNPATTVSYTLDRPGNVTLKIYNLNGQLVDTIVDGYIDAGYHSVVWNAKGHASGVYVVSLVSQGKRDFRKIMLVK